MKNILKAAELYHIYQVAGGFFGARVKAFNDYLDFEKVHRIFDIGCGPGHIVRHIPKHIDYIGFDTAEEYIGYANKKFKGNRKFLCENFDKSTVDKYGQPDLILMNGVLHHMDDLTACAVLSDAAQVLPDHGTFFSLDGCFTENQNFISHYLLKHDRGEFVRTPDEYKKLVKSAFSTANIAIRSDLSWIPYTFAIVTASKYGIASFK